MGAFFDHKKRAKVYTTPRSNPMANSQKKTEEEILNKLELHPSGFLDDVFNAVRFHVFSPQEVYVLYSSLFRWMNTSLTPLMHSKRRFFSLFFPKSFCFIFDDPLFSKPVEFCLKSYLLSFLKIKKKLFG